MFTRGSMNAVLHCCAGTKAISGYHSFGYKSWTEKLPFPHCIYVYYDSSEFGKYCMLIEVIILARIPYSVPHCRKKIKVVALIPSYNTQ